MIRVATWRRAGYLVLLLTAAAVFSCTSRSAGYRERLARLRAEVRNSFSPKFDPIWIAHEKKAEKAKQEIERLILVMDNALRELERYAPPQEMLSLHQLHRDLFVDCKRLLLEIQAEANKEKPEGMAAVRIYQKMTQKILDIKEKS